METLIVIERVPKDSRGRTTRIYTHTRTTDILCALYFQDTRNGYANNIHICISCMGVKYNTYIIFYEMWFIKYTNIYIYI